ncbi:MAG: LysM peptidoglycan-binding domain-containing protein [Acidobacteriota bacterium]
MLFLLVFLFFFFNSGLFAADEFSLDQISSLFPSEGFEHGIEFWKLIFVRYSEKDAVFHDRDDLRLIYSVRSFERRRDASNAEWRRQAQAVRAEQSNLQLVLNDIARYGPNSGRLQSEHRQIVDLLKKNGYSVSASLCKRLANNMRHQRGIKEKFQAGLVRSGRYLSAMEAVFEQSGLPVVLALMPHVESSFDYAAYSRVGAAGMWQFMLGTGRLYDLRIDGYLDERLDPLTATRAAARYLKDNYDALGTWPLALTAYNHGRNGMLRARKQYGSDFRRIVKNYQSRSFGFASKNFYPEFLAAVEIARNYEKYFGALPINPPLEHEIVSLDKWVHVDHCISLPEVTEDVLRDYNPQLTPQFWRGSRLLPAGLQLRVPKSHARELAALIEAAPAAEQYRVQSGDNLSTIARKFGISAAHLQRINGLRNPNRIYPGQTLYVMSGAPSMDRSAPKSYRVQRRDTLISIARKFGISLESLLNANKIPNANQIYLGQMLLIPIG